MFFNPDSTFSYVDEDLISRWRPRFKSLNTIKNYRKGAAVTLMGSSL